MLSVLIGTGFSNTAPSGRYFQNIGSRRTRWQRPVLVADLLAGIDINPDGHGD
jgi:hypothetical protein